MKVIIIGGGQVGAYLAGLLLQNHCSVKVIENREASLNKLKKLVPADIIAAGSGTDPNVLEACGIAEADVVAAVTGADETNLVAATIAKFEFDVSRVIARVNNPQNAWLFNTSMGVDMALNQADLMAHLIVEEMDLKNMLTLMKVYDEDNSIVQFHVAEKSHVANHKVKDLNIPEKAVLIAIKRGADVIIPRGNIEIITGDDILAFTNTETQTELNALFDAD